MNGPSVFFFCSCMYLNVFSVLFPYICIIFSTIKLSWKLTHLDYHLQSAGQRNILDDKHEKINKVCKSVMVSSFGIMLTDFCYIQNQQQKQLSCFSFITVVRLFLYGQPYFVYQSLQSMISTFLQFVFFAHRWNSLGERNAMWLVGATPNGTAPNLIFCAKPRFAWFHRKLAIVSNLTTEPSITGLYALDSRKEASMLVNTTVEVLWLASIAGAFISQG